MEVIKEIENIFLNRRELLLKFSHPNAPTPSKEEIKKQIIEKFKIDENEIDIKYIFSQKNKNYSIAKVFLNKIKKKNKEEGKENS